MFINNPPPPPPPPPRLQCPHLTLPPRVFCRDDPEGRYDRSLTSLAKRRRKITPLTLCGHVIWDLAWGTTLTRVGKTDAWRLARCPAGRLRRGGMWLRALFLSLSVPAPLSSLEQPLEAPQRKGCWALWADSLRPRCQTHQPAGQRRTVRHTQRERRDNTAGTKEKNRVGEKRHCGEETRL